MEFKDKFVGFVDILGWKDMVKAAEARAGMALSNLVDALKDLGTPEDRNKYEMYGPRICPNSTYSERGLDFQLTQISDCVIVSSEISPAGLMNLVDHCFGAVVKLLTKGIMCRGYITRGAIYHTDDYVIGSGYQEACEKEVLVTAFKRAADERGTPFIEVDPVVCDFVNDYGDSCVKEMFSRSVKTDGEVTALFPFKRLSHSFIVSGWGVTFDPEEEKRANQNMRRMIVSFKERVMALVNQSNPRAVSKANHYIAALDAQLKVCDRVDEILGVPDSPFPDEISR
ncbi:MAG: hypothetical protein M0Z71_02375 [Nitrospiraceae bacterium]|nr:hypothetical protein [Nitrospiraceae bacterium]